MINETLETQRQILSAIWHHEDVDIEAYKIPPKYFSDKYRQFYEITLSIHSSGKHPSLSEVLKESLELGYIKNVADNEKLQEIFKSNDGGDIKKMIATLKQGMPQEMSGLGISTSTETFALTDLGNSERLINLYGDTIRYCHELKKWFIWSGSQWREDNQGRIFYLATLTSRSILQEAGLISDHDKRRAVAQWSLRSESRDKIKAMVDLAQNNPEIIINQSKFDSDPWLINCQNGTINLKTGMLQEHCKDDYISKIMPISYDSTATCPIWEKTIAEIMGDKGDLIEYLHKAIGYSISGSVREQDIFIPYGTGANGKSTIIRTLMDMMGPDYTKQTTATALLVKQNECSGEDIAVLVGSRFVATIEVDDGKRLAESLVKQLTGGDKVRARFLYSNSFEFEPTFKLWLVTNHKPKVSGTDQGIWRRLKLIPFTVTIPEEKQDRNLPEKLKAELPGIFNWCIEGCLKWQTEGLKPPREVMAAVDSYRAEMDIISQFLTDSCRFDPALKSSFKSLYDTYTKWCEGNGERPVGQRKFNTRLRERGLFSYTGAGNYMYWQGIGVVTNDYGEQPTSKVELGRVFDYPL